MRVVVVVAVAEEGCLLILKGQMELCDVSQLNGKRKLSRRRRTSAEKRETKNLDEWEEQEIMTLYEAQEVICKYKNLVSDKENIVGLLGLYLCMFRL